MTAWRLAWRVRGAALRASLVPFALMLILLLAEPALFRMAEAALGPGFAVAGYSVLLDALYLAIDGIFVAALLEALLSDRPPAGSRPPLLPRGRAFRFGLAMLPVGIAAALLHFAFRYAVIEALDSLPPDALEGLSASAARSVFALIDEPSLQWLLAGLAVAPLALRLLRLPALDGAGRRPPARPGLGLLGTVFAAFVVAHVLGRGADALLNLLLGRGAFGLPFFAGWYVATFVLLTLVAAAVAAMLLRRRAGPVAAPAGRAA